MKCAICTREAGHLIETVDHLRDMLIYIGGLAARGCDIGDEEATQIMGALYDLREIRQVLDSGEGDEEAAVRDLAVLRQAAAGRSGRGRPSVEASTADRVEG